MSDTDKLPGAAPPSSVKLQSGTARPLTAYPKQAGLFGSYGYVDAFSRALGLKRTPTELGGKVEDV
jgi:hypothetical protein